MIRNVCIHIENEQPLLADLYALPSATDVGLLCTNVRMLDGKRPVFIDRIESTFFFPYRVVRFLELPEGVRPEPARSRSGSAAAQAGATQPPEAPEGTLLPVAVAAEELDEDGDGHADADLDIDLEIDEGFLQRIRDI